MSAIKRLFHTKPITAHDNQLRRCLTSTDLMMLGIGAIIGAGIFVLTGIAAATQAGPAIIFSYLLAGLACGFSAFAYAELASSIGGCGSAYGYAYAGLGELIAWIIGWDLLLEYGMDAATVSIGWSGYVQDALSALGISLPKALTTDPFHGGIINLPAALIIGLIGMLLSLGVKESARANKIIVFIKLSVITLFIVVGSFYFNIENWKPFMPFGFQGIVNGAGLIFFAYIGFDAVSTAADEAIKPQRDIPRGIIGSLIICTIIYIIVAALLTGISQYSTLNVTSPVAAVLLKLGHRLSAEIVAIGAIAGLTTVILVMYFGLTRIFLAMSRDGLLPNRFGKIHQKSQTPRRLIGIVGVLMAVAAGVIPINHIAEIVNIGTLAAFTVVCAGVIVLRYTKPDMPRPFRTPWSPLVPSLGIIFCVYLMSSLPVTTWISFSIWTFGGLVIYFSYSRLNGLSAKTVLSTSHG
jgi:APA family basic amino acid/polyamine antiporter